MKKPTRFLTNDKGDRIAVIIEIEEYEKLLDELEELEDIRACAEAKASGEVPIPLDEAISEIEKKRK